MADETSTRRFIILFVVVMIIVLIVILIVALRYKGTSATSSSVTGCNTLPPPQNVTAVSVNTTNILVTWNMVVNAVKYKVYLGTVPQFSKANAINTYTTGQLALTIEGQVLGRTYYIMVDAINGCGNSSPDSTQTSVSLGFPPRFRIISKDQPSLALKIAPDFQNIIVENLCGGTSPDDLCVWQYDPFTGFIQAVSSPTDCMKTIPAIADVRVKIGACSDTTYVNYATARQWNYDTSTGSLCNPANSEGIKCVKISGTSAPGDSVVKIPYDGTLQMQWSIVQA